MADLKKKIYENVCCFVVLLLVMLLVYLFATLTFAKSSPLFDYGPKDNEGSNIIHVKTNDKNDINDWIKRTDKFLEDFLPNDTHKQVTCDFGDVPAPGKFCQLNMHSWPAGCSAKTGYGYKNSTPCVFLHLNPEADWLPDYFVKGSQLPDDSPGELKAHIDSQHSTKVRQVWVSCVGQEKADQENMGKIHYIPWHGFPNFFYPSRTNTPGYSKPLVAVQFENVTTGVEINVECRAWANNIPKGSQGVQFKLFVDKRS